MDGVPSMNADEDRDNDRKLREERLIASMEEQVGPKYVKVCFTLINY